MEIQTLKLKLKIASDKKKAQAKRKALDFSAETEKAVKQQNIYKH